LLQISIALSTKMKIGTYIFFLLAFSQPIFGQEWRDTLREARQAYINHDYEKSYNQYRSAQKLAPKQIDLSDEIGHSAYKAGKYQDAEKIFAKSSSNKGNPAQKGNVHRQIGDAKMQQRKYEEAAESYKESLRNNPQDSKSRYNLTQALKKVKEQKQQQKEQQQKEQQQNQNQKNQVKDNSSQKSNPNQPNRNQAQPQSKSPSNSEKKQGENNSVKLSDKKTERMLDELVKKEMETKKKFDGVKGSGTGVKRTGKDW
jgi:Ca-activated chloride channel family protein